jgi:hypothetical protein
VAAVAAADAGAFAVCYRTAVGADPIPVSARESAAVYFESVAPMRRIGTRHGQRNFVGSWWLATTKCHVTFESWCERNHLIAFDFDPDALDSRQVPLALTVVTTLGPGSVG